MDQTRTMPGNVLVALGIREPDLELARADLASRVHRLVESRRCSPDEAAALLSTPTSELPALFQGRLATCSLDQLLRMLTWLGDDIEILIRPRIQRTKRGTLRVLLATAVEKPHDFEPIRRASARRLVQRAAAARPDSSDEEATTRIAAVAERDERQLLNKHAVEKMTSLDITTIYRKMTAGTFPQPVRVGRRRVAWRTSDITRWQQQLDVGTETVKWRAARSGETDPTSGGRTRRGRK